MKKGEFYYYKVKYGNGEYREFLSRCRYYGSGNHSPVIRFDVLATNSEKFFHHISNIFKTWDWDDFYHGHWKKGEFKRVLIKQFPLYINWPYISPEFEKLLKGI
jgi:hypothetical protein